MAVQTATYKLVISISHSITVGLKRLEREEFYSWLWSRLGSECGLSGIHEGTLLSAEAHEQGFETESFTIDAGEAPRERDWIGGQSRIEAELYFLNVKDAQAAIQILQAEVGADLIAPDAAPTEVPAQDWDAEWKASFRGVEVPPFWRVLPPWEDERATSSEWTRARGGHGQLILRLNPGAGFGTGTHETTQLCLGFLAELALARGLQQLRGLRVLDFGSGSGILSIGAALLGASVDAVEIDELANLNAHQNAELNSILVTRVESLDSASSLQSTPHQSTPHQMRIAKQLARREVTYDIVIANILKPVLLEFERELVARARGTLILSGLVEADVLPITEAFAPDLGGARPTVRAQGEWRGLMWMRSSDSTRGL